METTIATILAGMGVIFGVMCIVVARDAYIDPKYKDREFGKIVTCALGGIFFIVVGLLMLHDIYLDSHFLD